MKRRNSYSCRWLFIVSTVQEGVATFLSHTPRKLRYFGRTDIDIVHQEGIVRQYISQGYSYGVPT